MLILLLSSRKIEGGFLSESPAAAAARYTVRIKPAVAGERVTHGSGLCGAVTQSRCTTRGPDRSPAGAPTAAHVAQLQQGRSDGGALSWLEERNALNRQNQGE